MAKPGKMIVEVKWAPHALMKYEAYVLRLERLKNQLKEIAERMEKARDNR